MSNGNGRVAVQGKHGHWLSHYVAVAHHHYLRALELHSHTFQQFNARRGRAGGQRRLPQHQAAHVERVEAVDILVHPYVVDDRRVGDVLRERAQGQYPADRRVVVQPLHDLDDLLLGGLHGERLLDIVEPHRLAVPLHLLAVHPGAEIVTYHQGGYTHGDALFLQLPGRGDNLRLDLIRYRVSINNLGHLYLLNQACRR